ncbi:MAG: DUF2793 domain-containing protein [Sphingomonadaceae bacterium]|nr:DUF2793 domain-containing protein [Sphingomonadaceae bacterium]
MSDPLFDSRTARLDLPLLFAGQSQKESYVNESFARIDALLHAAVEAELAAPPASPQDGQCWLVGAAPSGAWTGRSGALAAFQQGQWLFQAPRDGLRLLNRATGQELRYRGVWQAALRPALPTGGTIVDTQSRATIAAIIDALAAAGIIAAQ